ncbi:carbonic anhydrase family protein [Paucibacter sp. B2R-40]|uniref:carbonic anhydrase n=1 Tax=Paucibacter sp. B2R-40 TaxID=2893554 RepID=UPI0021E4D50A|nr:carbonic anhydrase family protein [Paucibacter sp. B2R-40]MCV2354705.1 carbonic anhydrase family protein [Paucibacter sp. B2R-40]
MEEKITVCRRPWVRLVLLGLVCGAISLASANEAKPKAAAPATPVAGEESLDVLRQRLAERLSNKADGPAPGMKVTATGGHEEAGKSAKAGNKAGKKAEPAAHAATEHAAHWGYVGEGAPERWAELSPENRQCAIGTRQSPIDIREGIRVELEKINFDYRPSNFAVLDNGHTIQVNVAPGNALQVMGRRFELLQFHFHRPSEERINGRQYDMVAHLVHKDADGKLAVVAVLLERGRDQALIQNIWNNLPLEKGEALAAPGLLDLNQLLPDDRSYFTYMGSLTTPPCSEGVLWMVMRSPVQLSANQISIFSRLYPMNARPIQSGSGRLIKESSGGP